MFLLGALVFFSCLTAYAVDAGNNNNLVAVIQLFRHGQRTPNVFYAKDTYSSPYYWGGLASGQLTHEGKRQAYNLGLYTRQRYSDWLPNIYNRDDIYVQSTDVDRTLMSAQANLYAIYPEFAAQVWRKRVNWQPIPIHIPDSDLFSAHLRDTCTAFYKEKTNILTNDLYYVNLNATYATVYSYLSENSGNNVNSLDDIHDINDNFRIKSDVGYELPSWASSVFPSPLDNLTAAYFESYSYNTKLKRLGVGPLLNKWITYFDEMAQDPSSNPRFQIYSGHDFNLASVLNSLGGFSPPFVPSFCSSLYLELRKTGYGAYYVNAFRKDGGDVVLFSINGCALNCTLSNVRTSLKDILVDVDTRNVECWE